MPAIITLHTALPAAVPGQAPEWLHLCPAGEFRGRDGRGPYRIADPSAVIDASMREGGQRLVLDENHATDHAMAHGGPAPAVGWLVEMQARDDGIWGRPEWTRRGRELMADLAYRGLSPAIAVSKSTGQVLSIVRASLTNAPNFDLVSLHSTESTMDLNRLRTALGLAADADEEAILAAAAARNTAVSTHTAEIGRIAAAAGVTAAGAGVAEIVTALQARGDRDLEQRVVALNTQLTELQQATARERAEAAVDAAIAQGKPIRPLRDRLITRHMQDPAGVTAELATYPSINAGGLGGRGAPAPGGEGLTPEDERTIQLMGLDREAFKKRKAALGQEVV